MQQFFRNQKHIVILLLLLCRTVESSAQGCTIAVPGGSAGTLTFTNSAQLAAVSDKYFTFTGVSGKTYNFSFCDNSATTIYDTYITIRNAAGTTAIAWNDDGGGACGTKSYLSWVCPANATYQVLVTRKTGVASFCNLQTAIGNMAYWTTAVCPGDLGAGVNNITIPYNNVGSTCGQGNDITSANTTICGNSNYFSGQDEVYVFTPSSSGLINITMNSFGFNTGITLFDGCPLNNAAGGSGACIGYAQSSSSAQQLCASVIAGKTYYLILDTWNSFFSPCIFIYNLNITAPSPLLSGATCSSAAAITLPFSATNETTQCRGNDYSNASLGSCGTPYESAEDKVYAYTATGSECIGISLTGASSNSIGFQVYKGCPGSAGTTCIGNAGGATSGTLSGTVNLPGAGTYYIVVDNQAGPSYVNYNISITSFGAGSTNDLPCSATPLTLTVTAVGTNACSGSSGEPAAPGCWTPAGNIRNTVWFTAVAPASGKLRITVTPGTLTNPQIALYSGTCGPGLTFLACNDNTAGSCSASGLGSEILQSGLTPGATYYIAVDGVGLLTGSFSIVAADGNVVVTPLTNGQDCGTYIPVCDTIMSFGNPGFQGYGNVCDFSGSGLTCLTSGERGSSWLELTINGVGGFLEFTIIPKDWTGPLAPVGSETDYDFAVYQETAAPGFCSGIAAGTTTPAACVYGVAGITGLYSNANGNAPPGYPAGYGPAFKQRLAVTPGAKYVIIVQNGPSSSSGFDIIFSSTSPIVYGGSPTSPVYWTGGVDSDWNKKQNWGGCALPSCTRNAVINPGPVIQPVIPAGFDTANNVIINAGATLTLMPGANLSVCSDFKNFGTLTANTGSTVTFMNPLLQNIDGNIVAPNAFSNVVVNKSGSSVRLLQSAEMRDTFLVSVGAFNANGKLHKVGGHFINNSSYLPASPATSGTLELNGTAAQEYTNGQNVNNLIMNNTGGGVTLKTNMNIGTAGKLTLTSGKIIGTGFNEVYVKNFSTAAITAGSNISYVDGTLRRNVSALGAYEFPVGNAAGGYQNAKIDFTYPASPSSASQLAVSFQSHPALPAPLGAVDCGGKTFSSNGLDNGYWTFTAVPNNASGDFDLTLYNNNYTNAATDFTIMADDGFGNWMLGNGTCVPSPVTAVTRSQMTGITNSYGTAQSPGVLPINLLSFTAHPKNKAIVTQWKTAGEKENKGFELERTSDKHDFVKIGWVDGAGNSSAINSYQFIDHDVKPGVIYYYRLRQVDYNSDFSYSPVVSAKLTEGAFNALVFPNPITSESVVSYQLDEAAQVSVELINTLGESIVLVKEEFQPEGYQQLRLNAHDLKIADGIYTLKISTAGKDEFLKVVIAGR